MSKMGSHDPFGYLNISYDQKKSQESNYQFDSQPLKVGNRLDVLTCKCCATYHWKALNEATTLL
jgi:hypothetical protein